MKGRSTGVVGIRLPDETLAGIRAHLKEGETPSSWVKDLVVRTVNTMDLRPKTGPQIQTPSVNTTDLEVKTPPQSQVPSVNTTQADKIAAMRAAAASFRPGQSPAGPAPLPVYNPAIHKVGDRVRVQRFGRWQEWTVQELDADGHPIPA